MRSCMNMEAEPSRSSQLNCKDNGSFGTFHSLIGMFHIYHILASFKHPIQPLQIGHLYNSSQQLLCRNQPCPKGRK
jgi:hypothetical protein